MLASSFYASRSRDATRRMSTTELICTAPSQQRLRRSSIAAALQPEPSTQLVVFVAFLLEVLPAAPRGGTLRHLEGGRALRAASAPSQQHQQATAMSREPRPHERSTGRKTSLSSPRKSLSSSNYLPLFCTVTYKLSSFIIYLPKELRSLP